MKNIHATLAVGLLACLLSTAVGAQPLFTPWGNVMGIYLKGEKMDLVTSLRAVEPGWGGFVQTEKYNWEGEQTYGIDGKTHTLSHELQGMPVGFTIAMTETGDASAGIEVSVRILDDVDLAGLYYCMEVPGADFIPGELRFFNGNRPAGVFKTASAAKNDRGELFRAVANKVVFVSDRREYTISTPVPVSVFLRNDYSSQPAYLNDPLPRQTFVASDPNLPVPNYQLYFTIADGRAKKGRTYRLRYDLQAGGEIDRIPAQVTLDATQPGRSFDGIGGNFRLQFPDLDPAVIDYCLENLDVTWGRVPFYWDRWHPEEGMDPVLNAKNGNLDKRFAEQMEMAARLVKMNMPIIFSVWWPPAWAVDQRIKLPKGVALDNGKITAISESIASFFVYIKQAYGIEADYFSFNESDYGVEVFQTPEDHAFQLKAIGERLVSKGLKTKVLIGDTGAGTARATGIMRIIEDDPELHKYAGAVSFHMYHGCTNADLEAWARVAGKTNLPIMMAEGGTNSAAHRYPLIFLQPWFQLDEADKYVRICAITQPITLLIWQLTADYSVLTGGGLYGDQGPLRPTQRYWNLKQLSLAPAGSFALPVTCDRPNISCAAYGDILNGLYALHFVNNGATREMTVNGIPAGVTEMDVYVTDATRGMEKVLTVAVSDGMVRFTLEAATFTTLRNKQAE